MGDKPISESSANETGYALPPPLVGGGQGEGWQVLIEGGIGIGRVTKPGLAVPVGEWAINPVPRKMITQIVCEVFTYAGAIHELPLSLIPHVTISIPNGEQLAKKTLNARLGIIGGLSILGTTGIVKPVSAEAWTDTIDAAIDVALACGSETIVLSTGRTSEVAVQRFFNANTPTTHLPALTPPPPSMGGGRGEGENAVPAKHRLSPSPHPSPIKGEGAYYEESFVMMGDHVGYAVRACVRKGVKSIIVAGQFAKLLKIACGHEQTHVSSSRLDLESLAGWLNDYSLRLGISASEANTAREVLDKSGNNPELISLVCGRAAEFVGQLAPGLRAKVFLAGYGGEVLYYGPNQR